MKSHQLVSNRQIPAKLHDSLRLANRGDRNRSCSSVNAALERILFSSVVTVLTLGARNLPGPYNSAMHLFICFFVRKIGTRPGLAKEPLIPFNVKKGLSA